MNVNVIIQRSEELALFVFDEEDNETLLLHRISPDDIYRKQEGTIMPLLILANVIFSIGCLSFVKILV